MSIRDVTSALAILTFCAVHATRSSPVKGIFLGRSRDLVTSPPPPPNSHNLNILGPYLSGTLPDIRYGLTHSHTHSHTHTLGNTNQWKLIGINVRVGVSKSHERVTCNPKPKYWPHHTHAHTDTLTHTHTHVKLDLILFLLLRWVSFEVLMFSVYRVNTLKLHMRTPCWTLIENGCFLGCCNKKPAPFSPSSPSASSPSSSSTLQKKEWPGKEEFQTRNNRQFHSSFQPMIHMREEMETSNEKHSQLTVKWRKQKKK